jgi:hypothetical protein
VSSRTVSSTDSGDMLLDEFGRTPEECRRIVGASFRGASSCLVVNAKVVENDWIASSRGLDFPMKRGHDEHGFFKQDTGAGCGRHSDEIWRKDLYPEHIAAKSSNAEDYEFCDDDQTGQDGNVSHQPG